MTGHRFKQFSSYVTVNEGQEVDLPRTSKLLAPSLALSSLLRLQTPRHRAQHHPDSTTGSQPRCPDIVRAFPDSKRLAPDLLRWLRTSSRSSPAATDLGSILQPTPRPRRHPPDASGSLRPSFAPSSNKPIHGSGSRPRLPTVGPTPASSPTIPGSVHPGSGSRLREHRPTPDCHRPWLHPPADATPSVPSSSCLQTPWTQLSSPISHHHAVPIS